MKRSWINSPYTFALGMFAMMVPSQAFTSFYSYFYVEKLGLGIGLATLARTIFLIWDAVNNPLFGYWSDRTNTRYGRRRPWVFGAIPLFMLFFVLVFSPPGGLSENGLFIWFLVTLVLFEAAATVLWVNYGALFPELFRGDRLRAKASAIQQGYQVVALLIATALTPVIYAAINFSNMAILYACIFGLFMLLCMMSVRENPESSQGEQLGLIPAFKETMKNKKFWVFNISNSFAQTVNGLISSMIPFYAKYVLNISEAQVSILLAAVFVSVIPLVFVWYWIIRKMDGVKAWRLSLYVYGLSVIPLWFGYDLVSGIIAGVAVGFGLAGFFVTPALVGGRIIDEDEEKTGLRREGIYTAVAGFITRSSGLISALAFLIAGMIFGYESGDNPGASPELTFRYLISVVPLCLLVISVVLSYTVKFNFSENKRGDHDLEQTEAINRQL
ncbi:GPH family glycoside/pentoside/hexuronide:cation symporter [Fontibacillus solani]|uniref:GPH family glycoside/pentoside/hexuronide:cation symporter n=1 Tax=Fontibacillus solani TaxID=1572857 RepID=A0A7W3SPK6_9BACL|nr:MFS transporter [Fontibacillus solani]MBA9083737.1 GPH family glycoside/pentoside/hexuronide:cation symporter [Fontibacillus solani]